MGSKVASSTSRKLLAQGKKTEEVSSITGYSRNWIYCVVRRYNSSGIAGVGDRRRGNYGTNSILDDLELAELWQALQGEGLDGGLWNGTKVADCLSKWKGEPVHRQRGWEILKQMTFRLRVPRPAHTGSDKYVVIRYSLAQNIVVMMNKIPNSTNI